MSVVELRARIRAVANYNGAGSAGADSGPRGGAVVPVGRPDALAQQLRVSMDHPARLLLVEDDRENRLMLQEALGKWGYQVTAATSGEEALQKAGAEAFDLVLSDIRMEGVDGLQVLKAFRAKQPRAQVIMMTGFGTVDSAVDSIRLGAFDYVSKPFKFEELRLTLQRAMEQLRSPQPKASAAPQQAVVLIGHSRAMAEIYKTIARVAAGKSTVLIRGESGCGKELVARALHEHSERSKGPFLAINCAALPEALLESELFGYAKGAHSTAAADKPGLLELASGGTLLLDEIGDMSLTLQSKFLRVLEEAETRRLGDTKSIRTDVRILAATNKPLEKMIKEEKFRSDLFYRLNVVTLTVPPLREHKEDIPALVDHFMRRTAAVKNPRVTGVSPEVFELLTAHSWPGNVRELENVIERAVVLNNKSTVMPEDLPETFLRPKADETLSLQEMERRHIVQALQQTKGNVKAAAGLLGIDRKTLYRKAAEYGVDIVRE